MDQPFRDDDLTIFARDGTPPLPAGDTGYVANEGARIWYADMGEGKPVILLHGGLGHSGNFAHQVPALLAEGYRVIAVDSRGHGRSTRDAQDYSYKLMSRDTLAVMDHLSIDRAALVGWSDGACTSLVLADHHPDRVAGVVYFACNMDPSGALPFVGTPVIDHCFSRHGADYAALSETPADFSAFVDAVGLMQRTQPNYTPEDLARITVPVAVLQAEGDEFIRREHADYLSRVLPYGTFELLEGVTHFAPLQRPDVFNAAVLRALASFRL